MPSSTHAEPMMTFELRFDRPMIAAGGAGLEAARSPLVISPPLAGKFVWLSPRSGVFTPTEPLALDTSYHLTLLSGLATAAGHRLEASLRKTLTTPPFQLTASQPQAPSTNATSEPELRLFFNAAVDARDAARYLEFVDAVGRRVEVEARQGIELDRFWGPLNTTSEWPMPAALLGKPVVASSPEISRPVDRQTNEVANLIVVTPRQPLPVGRGWRLRLEAGLPSRDPRCRTHASSSVALGDITPFLLERVSAANGINSGRRLHLSFSKDLSQTLTNRWREWIELEPMPENLSALVWGHDLVLQADFQSQATYRLKVRAGLPAEEAFRLAEPSEHTEMMPPVEPRLYFPGYSTDQMASGNRAFPLMLVNTPRVRVRAKLLEPGNVIHALRGYASYFKSWKDKDFIEEPHRRVDYNLVPGRTVHDVELQGTTEVDETTTLQLTWDDLLPGRKSGVVFLEAERAADDALPRLGTQALIQLTDLGLLWKEAREGVQVFVFSQATGKPLPGATTQLLGDENEVLREAATDASGLARLEAHTNATWVAVRLGEDFHALELSRHRLGLYQYNLPLAARAADEAPTHEVSRRVLLFNDRDFYRPGETLYLKAIAREWTDAGLRIPAGLDGFVTVADARGKQLLQTNVSFSTEGSWSLAVALPERTPRGTAQVTLHLGEETSSCFFQVQDFQPSAFEIKLDAKSSYPAGEPIELPLSARYYFGKALSHARVKWTIQANDSPFRPTHYAGFRFEGLDLDYSSASGSASVSSAGEGTLSGTTNLVIAPVVPLNPIHPQPRAVSVTAEITDLNQQTISHEVEFTRHSSDFYLGLKEGEEVLTAGEELPVNVAVVGADEKPWPQPVNARLILRRVDWENVLVRGAGRTARYRNYPVVTNVLEKEIVIHPEPDAVTAAPTTPASLLPRRGRRVYHVPSPDEASGQALPGLVVTDPGKYLLELHTRDAGGREVTTAISLVVAGKSQGGWDYRNDVQIPLQPDKPLYQPGETAELLVETPISGIALVTVERESVRRSFLAELQGTAPSVRVPLEPSDAPNVFVSVTVLRGANDSPDKVKAPEYRQGYCQLTVQDPANRLAVTITPAATNTLPGETVEVTVEVRDTRDKAVAGSEVTLYAVDEGILSLSSYSDPNPYAFFYDARPLAVSCSISLPNLLTEDPGQFEFHNKGYLGGGGGQEHVRKNFLACAFWNAALRTGADGKLVARFPAPDSLTRYRLIAVAHAGAGAFGAGRAAFQVIKPLVIEPALARFANLGDRQVARAVVHNQTAQPGEVLISLALDATVQSGTTAAATLSNRVAIAAHGSAVIEFPVEFKRTGPARWVWRARFADPGAGAFTDAVQSTLEVGYPAPLLREILNARTPQAETNLLARANPQLLAGEGTVTLHVANTRLVELSEAFAYLLHYPYGCVEQASSTLLPWVVLRDRRGLAPLVPFDEKYREDAIQAGVARLFSMQTESGGLAYWPGAKEPTFWGSAYGGLVLALAEKQGVEVPQKEFGRLMEYLSIHLRTSVNRVAEMADASLALYALAVADRAEPAYHEQLYAQRARLSPEERALLALAVAQSQGSEEMIGGLLSTNVLPREYDETRFDCSARERAIRLMAWAHFKPKDARLEGFAAALMAEQEQSHWTTTQGDAWALLALVDCAKQLETLTPAQGKLVWGNQTIPFALEAETNVFTVTLPFSSASQARLLLDHEPGNTLHTSLTIEAHPPLGAQPRQDHGFSLTRTYERLDDDGQPHPLAGLRVGDRVLVTLRLSNSDPARYVALDDALPSTFEAIHGEFVDQRTRPQPGLSSGNWSSDFRELRQDRVLSFADWLWPGAHEIRYLARVRAAGTVTAPSAKVEAMYHPSRRGLAESQVITSLPME